MTIARVTILPKVVPSIFFGGVGLLIGFLALLFGLAVAGVAVVGSLLLVGFILLAIALVFLLPIIVPLAVVVLISRLSRRRKLAV